MKPLHRYLCYPVLIVPLLFIAACSGGEGDSTKAAPLATVFASVNSRGQQ